MQHRNLTCYRMTLRYHWNLHVNATTGLGGSHGLAICSAPDSQRKNPTLPNCTLSPENWRPPVCLIGGTREQCVTGKYGFPNCRFVSCVQPPPAPPPVPVPATNYQGCYKGKWTNGTKHICDLPYVVSGDCSNCKGPNCHHFAQWDRTLEGCNAACKNFKFFGVQYGGSGCFCGNSFGSHGAAHGACNMTCQGNHTEICGGPNTNSVYAVEAQE